MTWQTERDAALVEYADYLGRVKETDVEARSMHPHCDELILHEPGKCWACDLYPQRQRLRLHMLIAYTGEDASNTNLRACPAERARPLEKINRWGPNVARTTEQQAAADAEWAAVVAKWPGALS